MKRLLLILLLAILLPAKVNAQAPGPGEAGGPCIAGDCNTGLICTGDGVCTTDAGQNTGGNTTPTSEQVRECRDGRCICPENHISTAIGCINIENINLTARFFLGWGLGIAGGVALLLIALAGFRIATSQGDPRRLQGGQELLLSAIGGLIMIILSVYLLRFIGVDLLGIFSN